jgi:hypothetical protein
MPIVAATAVVLVGGRASCLDAIARCVCFSVELVPTAAALQQAAKQVAMLKAFEVTRRLLVVFLQLQLSCFEQLGRDDRGHIDVEPF